MSVRRALEIFALEGVPLVEPGDDLAGLILASLADCGRHLQDHDIVVIAQKVVSKAEGRGVDLAAVTPSPRAVEIAAQAHKDPRIVELILAESSEVLRVRPGVIIVEHRLGLVLANAGIDRSNVEGETALLLPLDPDGSAQQIREQLIAGTGATVGVMIIDSIGRAWRNGTIGTTIGASGIATMRDLRGQPDLFGRKLETTEVGAADEVAAAASLLMGQAAEATPVVVVRGVDLAGIGTARDLLRPKHMDLFR
ncbi:coenzyme F420-0 gamma-glutamyl ligase [Rhodopseudomonas palustris HaA2]|uniref:Coenzyme F420-0 gamma-glutamyl ligase n=1 Tax=Rhodopseudomonas palustris (strain HaA2) TaxID=316058 RepID=Q2IRR6_RHOP2|nr:coenzyme F420-0:L-glutamate ligase [Rhodopseudomonas palustris]ABD09094.1 coenzyme F420-0 gamma-glutamyl ligase [Rhodopseudomonas palustris HaA2]